MAGIYSINFNCDKMLPPLMGEASSENQFSHHCLLCYANFQDVEELLKTLNCGEVLTDIFQVFCKYMKWMPEGDEFQYNFSSDSFPFCQDCKIVLVEIYKLDEGIQEIRKQIQQIVLSASARILLSEFKRGGSQPDSPLNCNRTGTQQRETWAEHSWDSKSQYYRGIILKHYSASVQLTPDDRQKVKEFVGKNVHLENDDTRGQDQNVANSVAVGSMQEPTANAPDNFEGSQDDSSHDGAVGQADDDDDTRHSNYSDDSSMESDSDSNHENKSSMNKVGKKKGTSCAQPHEKSQKEESIVRQPYISRSIRGRIKKVGNDNDRYILDDKLEFEWTGHEWKCLSCSSAYIVRQRLIVHLKSKNCTGLASPESVEVLECLGFKYDKLTEDLFECRRCPYSSKSDDEIKNHIKEVHYQHPRKLDKWKLTRNASFTHESANVFLVNNEHRVRLSRKGKYCCQICSYSSIGSISKIRIIAHVLRKHDATRRRSRLLIKKIGPNKYGVGDFSFERLIDKYKCCTCDFTNTGLIRIREHIRHEHIKDFTKHVCETCGYSSFRKDAFDEHIKTHRNERPFLCDVCGKSSKTRQNANAHRLIHNSHLVQKNILCEQCGAKFPNQGRLNAHMKQHNSVACHICGKSYKEYYLKCHLQSHNKSTEIQKSFECKDCGKIFKAMVCLYIHRKSCNGDRPYSCDICGMKFTQHYSVTRHKNVAHDPNKTTKTVARKQPKLRREPNI